MSQWILLSLNHDSDISNPVSCFFCGWNASLNGPSEPDVSVGSTVKTIFIKSTALPEAEKEEILVPWVILKNWRNGLKKKKKKKE